MRGKNFSFEILPKKKLKSITNNDLICVKNEEKTACKSQDCLQSSNKFVPSHDHETVTFRNFVSKYWEQLFHHHANAKKMQQYCLNLKSFVFGLPSMSEEPYCCWKSLLCSLLWCEQVCEQELIKTLFSSLFYIAISC